MKGITVPGRAVYEGFITKKFFYEEERKFWRPVERLSSAHLRTSIIMISEQGIHVSSRLEGSYCYKVESLQGMKQIGTFPLPRRNPQEDACSDRSESNGSTPTSVAHQEASLQFEL